MPGTAGSSDILQQTVDSFAQRVQDYASGIAGRLGSPLSGQQLSQSDVVQRWNFSPLGSTDAADAAYQQLVAGGTPPGQALNQVYPMRSMLYQGADLKEAIANATKIAGWAADASGKPAPEPFQGSTLPLALAQKQLASMAAPGTPPVSPLPAQAVGPALPPPPQAPPVGAPPMPPPPGPIPAMASGGVVTQPTVALIGEQGPEAVVPLTDATSPGYPGAQPAYDPAHPQPGEIQNYIDQAARARGIDPAVAMSVAYFEGGRDPSNPSQPAFTNPAVRGTFATGSSWWPFQLHYGGPGYQQYGTTPGLGNDFTAQTGYQPGDPAAWRASVDFALNTALQRGWYPTFYGSQPAGVSRWQGIPQQQAA
jgi:hypothetical protein